MHRLRHSYSLEVLPSITAILVVNRVVIHIGVAWAGRNRRPCGRQRHVGFYRRIIRYHVKR